MSLTYAVLLLFPGLSRQTIDENRSFSGLWICADGRYVLRRMPCSVYRVPYAVYRAPCAVHRVPYTVRRLRYSGKPAVFIKIGIH